MKTEKFCINVCRDMEQICGVTSEASLNSWEKVWCSGKSSRRTGRVTRFTPPAAPRPETEPNYFAPLLLILLLLLLQLLLLLLLLLLQQFCTSTTHFFPPIVKVSYFNKALMHLCRRVLCFASQVFFLQRILHCFGLAYFYAALRSAYFTTPLQTVQ